MSKTIGSQKIKLVAAIGLSAFSVVSVAVATIAWFTSAYAIDNNDMEMKVNTPSSHLKKLTLHNSVNLDYANKTLQFDREPTGTATYNTTTKKVEYSSNFKITMDTYEGLNPYDPVLMLIELDEAVTATSLEPISVNAYTSAEEFFALANPDGSPKHEIKETGNPLSSVVEFFSMNYLATDAAISTAGSYTDSTNTYSTYDLPFPEIDDTTGYEKKSFAHFNATTQEYVGFDKRVVLYETTTATVQYIAVIVDYYQLALNYVYSTFLSEDVLNDTIYFSCDWSMEI